jgi:protein-tyrosine phosphatase
MTEAHPPVPIPDSYWVTPGQLLAGEYPGSLDERDGRRKLQAMLKAGIRSFIDLTEDGELEPYADWLADEADGYGLTVAHRRFAIRDYSVPTRAEMAVILDAIDAALAAGQPAYVHCWGGIGRTGTVVGCYLVRHGLAPDRALEEIARLRAEVPDHWRRSPESDEQVEMIMGWRAGE